MRAVALLPAATEIVAALGLLDRLGGVSHECDYPPAAALRPRATRCTMPGTGLPSGAVDRWVSETLAASGTLYRLDEEVIRAVAPDVIFTQALCDVCAVDQGSVRAFAETLPKRPLVVNLDPSTLDEVLGDVRKVAMALGEPARAEPLLKVLRKRVEVVRAEAAQAADRPRCFVIEWTDPVYAAGHWTPELVEIAGGTEVLGRAGEDSRRVSWEEVVAAAPEVLLLACCGYTAARTVADLPILRARPGWSDLPAVRSGRVFAVDGNAYFSRPGPRVVDSLEILAEVLHPEIFGGRFPERGVRRVGA